MHVAQACTADDMRLWHCRGCYTQFDHEIDRNGHERDCIAARDERIDDTLAFYEWLDADAAERRGWH